MAIYSYRAINRDSEIITDKLDAASEDDLEERLHSMGLTLIEASKKSFEFKRHLKLSDKDLLNLTYFLKLIFSSGMSLLEGLRSIGRQASNTNVSKAAQLLHANIESGKSVYGTMSEHPAVFPPIYVSLVRAGEISGNMDKVLEDASSYLDWKIRLKKDIISAFIYPAIVLTAVVLLMIVLFVFVLPKLIAVLTTMNAELPLVTRALMAFVKFARNYWMIIAAFIIFVNAALFLTYSNRAGKRIIDLLIIRIPLIGTLTRKFDYSRYFRTFATLFRSGLSVDKTLRISASVVKNSVIAESFDNVTNAVIGGELLSSALSKTGNFAPLIINIVEIGEKTGTLDSSVLYVSDIYEKEVPETIKKVFTIIEPLMIITLGAVVLMTIASFFLPLYKLIGGIRR
ncbi:MAG: type II secretion system F family protein [Nitrospirae bacterium]|nr:type II secretion system F family protein [Nitrospirota bacterium]